LIDQRKTRKTKKSHGSKKAKSLIDRRMITPGCRFTGEVVNALAYFICQRLSSRKYEHVKFYMSGANVAGEGELKIMKYIKSMPERMQQRDVFALVGSDADLVLLAIASRVPHISILNAISATSGPLIARIPKQEKADTLNSSSSSAHRGSRGEVFVEIGINKLIQEFSVLVPNSNSLNTGTDFVALSIMSGNDYLPKVPQFFIHQYWDHYLRARKTPQWAQENLIDPQTHRLNLDFLSSLLANSPPRSLMTPPIHHVKKLAKLRQLREDIAVGKLDKDEIIRRYSLPIVLPGSSSTPQSEEQQIMTAILQEQQEDQDLEGEEDDNPMFDDADDVDDSIQMDADSRAVSDPLEIGQAAVGGVQEALRGGQRMSASSHPSSSFLAAGTSQMEMTSLDASNYGSGRESNRVLALMRDPIEVFLEVKSRGTWSDYDADDHASQFIYGLEWVVNSYLRGECVTNDWYFPYSSSPGPKQLCDWIAKAKVDPTIVESLPTTVKADMHQASGDTAKGAETQTSSVQSSSSSHPSTSIPILTSSSSSINSTPYQPWMFAMMLLDSSTYDFVSPAIPMDSITAGSYVHEVHDTSYFFGFIDSDRMAAELSQLDISGMSVEDREYSFIGSIRLFERHYDYSLDAAQHNYMPRSPFESASESSSLRGLFRRTSIRDLKSHHHNMERQHGNNRQARGGGYGGGGGSGGGPRASDDRYQSQHTRDAQGRGNGHPQQDSPLQHQQQRPQSRQQQQHGNQRGQGQPQHSTVHSTPTPMSSSPQNPHRHPRQLEQTRDYHGKAKETKSSSTTGTPPPQHSSGQQAHNQGKRHHSPQDGQQQQQTQQRPVQQQQQQQQQQQSAYGKRVDLGSLFSPKPYPSPSTAAGTALPPKIPSQTSMDAPLYQAFFPTAPMTASMPPSHASPGTNAFPTSSSSHLGMMSSPTTTMNDATSSPASHFFPANPFGPILLPTPHQGFMSSPSVPSSSSSSSSNATTSSSSPFAQPSNPFKQH